MLESFLAPALARLPVKEDMFFQQDGATCHTLWECLKSQVLKAPAPHTVRELNMEFGKKLERIPVEMLQRVMSDCRKRLTEYP
ncbi:hypothetical protein B7P43_G01011 [Cryptotermes secundus]|uniref:Uncharacterized protein n=1 Tax=Cryptotermes secundus TaxID=105785 RepID=A0A2J7PGC2_9NEOP|nr:hypothetical protein B7P43_G01011 [Cryptotermes secundus]